MCYFNFLPFLCICPINENIEKQTKSTNKHNDFLSFIQFNYHHDDIDQKVKQIKRMNKRCL